MESVDILNISLAVGFISIAGFLSYALFQLAATLKETKRVLADVKDTTADFTMLKENMKLGVFSILSTLLATSRKALR